eukprot:6947372-Pyramimonas_sp.AAC.1
MKPKEKYRNSTNSKRRNGNMVQGRLQKATHSSCKRVRVDREMLKTEYRSACTCSRKLGHKPDSGDDGE